MGKCIHTIIGSVLDLLICYNVIFLNGVSIMVQVTLHCPFCGSDDVGKNGTSNGKQRYLCRNSGCSHKTFYAEYTYNGRKPEVKKAILKWSVDGAGIRSIARVLGISTATVISELKKKKIP